MYSAREIPRQALAGSIAGTVPRIFLFLISVFAAQPQPGDYDRLLLGVDGDFVTGHFSDCTGECKFECNFFFEGRRAPGTFEITTYFPGEPDAIRGTARNEGKTIHLRLESLPGGCWNVTPELKGAGARLLLDQKADWLQIRVLREKSYLRATVSGQKTIPLQAQQTVIVMKKQKDWFYVRKPGVEKTAGWLKESELFPLRSAGNTSP